MQEPLHIPPVEPAVSEPIFADEIPHVADHLRAHEYWHFDALSDDGREALIIRFHSNYPFSSRFFKQMSSGDWSSAGEHQQFPAICFTYSVDGAVVLHTVNEFADGEFLASAVDDGHAIGMSSFRIDNADYGSGYMVKIDLMTSLKRRIRAECEWLAIESGPFGERHNKVLDRDRWDLAAPRADVSSRIMLIGRRGDTQKLIHFRGTGYHDHVRSNSVVQGIGGPRCWGRVHFPDSTVVFQQLTGREGEATGDVIVIRDGLAHDLAASCDVQGLSRDRSGLLVPRQLTFSADEDTKLRVRPVKVVSSGFFEVQMLSEITLELSDGKHRSALGITEFSDPRRMKNPFFRWVTDLRTGKNGKSPLF